MSSQARVLVAAHAWYGDLIGGAFRLASEFAEYLATRNFDVTFLCCQTDPSTPIGLSGHTSGIKIFRYAPPPPNSFPVLRMRHHFRSVQDAVRHLCSERTIGYASLHSPLQARGALSALSKSATRTVFTVHSPFDDEIRGNLRRGLVRWASTAMARSIDRRCCASANVIHCASQYTLTTMTKKFPNACRDKGIVVPGWVSTSQFNPVLDRRELRGKLGGFWNSELPLFFCLRRLENRMGLDTLIEAARTLLQRGVDFRLLIGGGGSLRKFLEEKIRAYSLDDQVHLLGRLPEQDLPLAYAAADAFILPTRELECFGLILLEAFACDTPVIASRVAAIPEIAEQQGDGWMFEPGDAAQLADRMTSFAAGKLVPTINLREVALRYNKPALLREWEAILTGDHCQNRPPGR